MNPFLGGKNISFDENAVFFSIGRLDMLQMATSQHMCLHVFTIYVVVSTLVDFHYKKQGEHFRVEEHVLSNGLEAPTSKN